MKIVDVKELKRDKLGNPVYQVRLDNGEVCFHLGATPPPLGIQASYVKEEAANGKVWKRLLLYPPISADVDVVATSVARDIPDDGLEAFIEKYKRVKQMLME